MRNLSPEDFAQLLARGLNARAVVVGHDFRFGRLGKATAEVLAEAGGRLGFAVEVVPPVRLGGERISSSGVRAALARGDFAQAAAVARAPLDDARAGGGRAAPGT